MSYVKFYSSHIILAFFFYGSMVLLGLGLFIIEALSSHSGADYLRLFCTLVAIESTALLNSPCLIIKRTKLAGD